jgi:hypothetical protein
LSLSPVATASDIVSLLVEDRRRSKVMVRWDSGALEPLDEFVSIRAVRTHATQLEVKRRKSVHWT